MLRLPNFRSSRAKPRDCPHAIPQLRSGRTGFAATVLAPLLAACGPAEPPPKPLTEAESLALSPKDPRLATLYAGSCKGCHTVKDSQAPLTGDRTQWDPRWAQGEAGLLAAAIQGKKGMPAGGQCFECTPEDLKALIRFMAGHEQ